MHGCKRGQAGQCYGRLTSAEQATAVRTGTRNRFECMSVLKLIGRLKYGRLSIRMKSVALPE